jgi:aromatic ring-opening dioxygenase LigB subunit
VLSTIAVVPEPPLLVPELATGAAAETAALRVACREAARRLADSAATWVAVGADIGGRRTVGPEARGSFIGFGADVVVGLKPHAAGPVDPTLPLPLLIAAWLRDGLPVTVRGELVASHADPATCLALGVELAHEASALLIVGDGAATHTEKAPGFLDERAGPFDDAVAAALATPDPAALAALDPVVAAELWVAGRAPWQVLAGATRGSAWTGELLHSSRQFGVGYHVAVWQRCG